MTLTPLMERAGITPDTAAFALRTALVAWLAFAIATLLDIHNPYWAAMAVGVVSQPTRGVLLERGLYRLVGTLVGAGVGFALLAAVRQPVAALALLGLWVGACAGLVHLLRYVRAYGAVMAGMTAAVVVVPTLFAADETFALALARVECTVIGVLAALLLAGPLTPRPPRRAFVERVRALAADAVAWAACCLDPAGDAAARQGALLTAMGELDQAAGPVTAGSLRGYRLIRRVHALIATTLALMAAARGAPDRVAPADAAALRADLAALAGALRSAEGAGDGSAERALDRAGRVDARLHDALADLLLAEQALLRAPSGPGPAGIPKAVPMAGLLPHRDWPAARAAALAVGLATFAAGLAALWFDWAHGSLTVLGVAIFAMILSTMDEPQAEAPNILMGVTVGVTVAVAFRLLVLPHAGGTLDLVLLIAPFLLVLGLGRASRYTAKPALDANMCFLLASQPVLPAAGGPAQVVAGAAALVLAIVLVAIGCALLPRDPGRRARAVATAIVRDLERMAALAATDVEGNRRETGGAADGAEAVTAQRWRDRMHHRILRLMVHVGRADLDAANTAGVLAALDLGHALQRLRALAADLPERDRATLALALDALRAIAADPDRAAARLARLAAGPATTAELAGPLRAASAALTAGAGFFRFGSYTSGP